MGKLSALGGLITISGCVLLVFKLIGSVMGKTIPVADQSLGEILGQGIIGQIDTIQNGSLQGIATSVVGLPIYMHLILTGVVLLLISGMISK